MPPNIPAQLEQLDRVVMAHRKLIDSAIELAREVGPHDTIYAHQYLLQLKTLLPPESREVLGKAGKEDITNHHRFDLVNEIYTDLEGTALHWCINIQSSPTFLCRILCQTPC